MISVIIPVYNHAKELADCLKSLEKQTFLDFEVIVVDDESVDKVQDEYKNYSSKFSFTFFRLEKNQGAPIARNEGFARSKGELVIFLDADAVLRPDALQVLHQALVDHPDKGFAYSSFRFGWKMFVSFPFDRERLKRINYIHTSALIRREAFSGFDPSLKKFQDWDLWLTLSEQGREGVWVNQVLFSLKPRRTGYSHWLPRFLYGLPWPILGWMPDKIKRYREAERIIREKHHLFAYEK